MLLAFSGLDCSGKSTQIDLLKDYFIKNNKKQLVFWSRGGYTPGFQKLKYILRRISGKKLQTPGFSLQREKALSKPFIRRIWLTIAMLDLIYYYAFYLRLKKLLNYNIICDRYLMDTNIDFKLTYPQDETEKWFLWKLLKIVAPRPDYHFVLTISVEESQKRSKLKNEPFPDSPEVLNYRLNKYLDYCVNNKNVHHIECNKSIEAVKKEIYTFICK